MRPPAVSIPRITARSSLPSPALMTSPPNWILRRVSCLRCSLLMRALRVCSLVSAVRVRRKSRAASLSRLGLAGAKPRTRFPPLRQTRVAGLHRRLELQHETGENIVLGLQHADPLGQPADLLAPLRRQLRLPLGQPPLLRPE